MESRADRNAVDLALLAVRVIAGGIMTVHGAQKLFPVFGGPNVGHMAESMGALAYLVAIGEFFGGLGLLLGVLSRFSAAANIVIMIGAVATVHGANGFFAPKGFEYNLALIGLFLPILIAGPGRYTLLRPLPFPTPAGQPVHPTIE